MAYQALIIGNTAAESSLENTFTQINECGIKMPHTIKLIQQVAIIIDRWAEATPPTVDQPDMELLAANIDRDPLKQPRQAFLQATSTQHTHQRFYCNHTKASKIPNQAGFCILKKLAQAIYEAHQRENLRRAHALEGLQQREVFVGTQETELDARLTKLFRSTRTILQEGGASTLYLAL